MLPNDEILRRRVLEEAGAIPTIVIKERSSHTYTSESTGVTAIVAGAETLVSSPMYATNRASAYKQLSSTLGLAIYCINATTHPVVQAFVWNGLTYSPGAAVDFCPTTAYTGKGCTYASIARLNDNKAAIGFKYSGRSESVYRACSVTDEGVVTMLDATPTTKEYVSGAVTVPRVCESSEIEFLCVYAIATGTKAVLFNVDAVSGQLSITSSILALSANAVDTGAPTAGKVNSDQWLASWGEYKSDSPTGHYLYVAEIYKSGGELVLGTKNDIEFNTSVQSTASFGGGPICVLDATIPTCAVLYSNANSHPATKTWMRVITINGDHTVSESAATEISDSVSTQLSIERLTSSDVAGSYRRTEAGDNQNDLAVIWCSIDGIATLEDTIWTNSEDAVTEGMIGLTGTVDVVVLFQDTTSGDGYIQVFDTSQGSGAVIDTVNAVIRAKAQRSDSFTIGSMKNSGGEDVRQLVTFMPGG